MTDEHWATLISWKEDHLAERGAATTLCGRVLRGSTVWTNRPKRPCASCRMRRAMSSRTDFVDRMLDFLLGTEADTIVGVARDDGFRATPRFFDGVEPWIERDVYDQFAAGSEGRFFGDVRPSDLSEPRRVYFSTGGPGISLPTDPIGAREVFRLRDLPDGRARRAALRHWVTEHWRMLRSDPTEEAHVREHLRGETRFDWGGLECRIMPAPFDLEREEKAQAEAAAMRQEGSHHRLRAKTGLMR